MSHASNLTAAEAFVAGQEKRLEQALKARIRERVGKYKRQVIEHKKRLADLRKQERELRQSLAESFQRLRALAQRQKEAQKLIGEAESRMKHVGNKLAQELHDFKTKETAAERFLARRGKRKVPTEPELEYDREQIYKKSTDRREEPKRAVKLPVVQVTGLDGSNPQPTIAIMHVNDVQRQLNCPRDKICNDYAARKNWAGFHCDACSFKFEGRT